MENVLNSIHLQKLQDRLCQAGNVYGCCYDTDGKKITDISGPEKDVELLGSYVLEEQYEAIRRRICESEMEDLLVEDTAYPWLKMAAVDSKVEKTSSATWVFAAVLPDEAGEQREEAERFTYTCSEKQFYHFLDLAVEVSRMLLGNRASKVNAEAENSRSRTSEQEMNRTLKRLAATTEIVQLLDRDDAIETIMTDFLEIASRYLMVSNSRIYQLRRQDDTASMAAEWNEQAGEHGIVHLENVSAIIGKKGEKPIVISSNNSKGSEIRKELERYGVNAIAAIPLMIHNTAGMYVCFLEKKKEHIWSVEEIRYMNDAVRILQSIVTRRIQKNSLAGSYVSLEAILDNVGCGIYVKDKETGEIPFVNKYIRNTFPKELEEGVLDDIFSIKMEPSKESGSYEIHYFERDLWYDFYYTTITWVTGRKVLLCSMYNISDKKSYQQKIEQQAYTDFLTGLYNRMCCEKDLARFIDSTKKYGTKGALLYLDLDDFKHINDGLGHQYGDVLLRSIAHSVQRVSGIADTCYRMGGDEFVVIIPPEHYSGHEEIVEEIKRIFDKPWYLKDADYYCTMSMGVVTFPDDGESVEDLIKKADISMYDAKKGGKNRIAWYSDNLKEVSSKRLDMEKNMRAATVNGCGEFEVYYQPIIDVTLDGTPCTGAEALVRWNNEKLGFVAPADFIPLAEYLGLINPIGNYILEQACKSCRSWNDRGHENYKVNVNLSVIQLLQPDIVEIVKQALEKSGLSPRNLTLEVTESLAINDMRRMQEILGSIKALGVRIALDDFGTGYSSLSHIREIPLDVIKVDQSFVKDLAEDDYSQAFVKMVAELARTRGVSICVEGIETEAQYKVLESMNIQLIQGYYFDRPMRQEDFEAKYI